MTSRRQSHGCSMKRRLMFLACAAVIFAAVILVILLSDTPPPTVRLVFLGYTNTGEQPEAVFSVQFPPKFGGCGWRDPEVSRKEGTVLEKLEFDESNRTENEIFHRTDENFARRSRATGCGFRRLSCRDDE